MAARPTASPRRWASLGLLALSMIIGATELARANPSVSSLVEPEASGGGEEEPPLAGPSESAPAAASSEASASPTVRVDGTTSPIASLPAKAIDARVSVLQRLAYEAIDRGDWLSAADAFEEAFVLTPDNMVLAYKIGEAANNAHDCARADIYLERFARYGDPNLFAPEIAIAKRVIGELQTFECPPRTAGDKAARAKTLAAEAEALAREDDWGGAAARYAEAYQLDPDAHGYAYHVALTSWNGRECTDAIAYFKHFESVADPREHHKLLDATARHLEDASASLCPSWAEGERDAHARVLYEQARSLEASLDFSLAIDKYERAYAQLSDSHAFAFRIAESAWMAQLCEKAAEHYRIFTTKIDASNTSYAGDLQRASEILAKVDALGCPDALYTRAEVISAEPASGGDEQPPASSATCAVAEGEDERGVVGLLMLGLLGLIRRRGPSGTF